MIHESYLDDSFVCFDLLFLLINLSYLIYFILLIFSSRFLLFAVIIHQAVSSESGKRRIFLFVSVRGRISIALFTNMDLYFLSGCEGSECLKAGVSGKPKQYAEFLNKFNEMNTQTPQRQHRNAEAVLPFVGLTGGEIITTAMLYVHIDSENIP